VRARRAVLLLLAAALLVRVLALLAYTSIPLLRSVIEGGDTGEYMQLARNLLADRVFRFDGGSSTAFRMPGYPLFLVLAYALWHSAFPAIMIQILADLLTISIVCHMARQLRCSMICVLVAGSAVAFNPLLIISALSLLPETLSVCLTAMAVLSLILVREQIRTNILAFVALSASIYLKPTMAPVSLALMLLFALRWLFVSGLKRKTIMLMLPLIVIIAMAPWTARNHEVMRAFVPLTTSNGTNLYGGNNPHTDGGYVSDQPYVLPGMTEVESDHALSRRVLAWIKANPREFAHLLPLKALRFLWPLSRGTSGYVAVPMPIFLFIMVTTIMFYLFVCFGIWSLIKRKYYWELRFLPAVPTSLLFISLLTFGAARFALPGFPGLAVLAALGAEKAMTILPGTRQCRRAGRISLATLSSTLRLHSTERF